MTLITRKSLLSGINHTLDIDVEASAYQDWMDTLPMKRPLIQNAFPNLSPEQREFLITGITPEEWDKAFGSD